MQNGLLFGKINVINIPIGWIWLNFIELFLWYMKHTLCFEWGCKNEIYLYACVCLCVSLRMNGKNADETYFFYELGVCLTICKLQLQQHFYLKPSNRTEWIMQSIFIHPNHAILMWMVHNIPSSHKICSGIVENK